MSLADHQGRRPASFRQPEAMDKDLKSAAGPLRQMTCTASARLKTDGLQRTIAGWTVGRLLRMRRPAAFLCGSARECASSPTGPLWSPLMALY
jgi:hypothetical protein